MIHINTSILYKQKVANVSLVILVVIVVFGLLQGRNQLAIRYLNFTNTIIVTNNRTYKVQHLEIKNTTDSFLKCTLLDNKNLVSKGTLYDQWNIY